MKKHPILFFLLILTVGCGPSDYFRIIDDNKLYSEKEFNIHFKAMIKDLPKDYSLTPIIYHRNKINDSITNYVYFKKIWWANKKIDPKEFEIVYKQDSTYLFLNRKLPEFKLRDLKGNVFTNKQLSGKPTLINFWAINCRGCVAEITELNNLTEKYQDKVNFVAITWDDRQSVEKFLLNTSFEFYHLINASSYLMDTLMIKGIPLSFFLDKNGIVKEIKNVMPAKSDRFPANGLPELSNREFDKILEKLINL